MSAKKRRAKGPDQTSPPLPIILGSPWWFAQLVQLPLRLVRAWTTARPRRIGLFIEFGRFIWIERHEHATELYQAGFFGKGTLSRSEPTWFTRLQKQCHQKEASGDSLALEQITVERRKQRRERRRQKANEAVADENNHNNNDDDDDDDVWQPDELLAKTGHTDHECLQLDLLEAFFLAFALDALEIHDTEGLVMSIDSCWTVFNRVYSSTATFTPHYAAYHYYRSLGWVPKNGAKFGVHFGPRFRHADFAVYVMDETEPCPWEWLLRLSRICTQVKKTLVLCYVSVPEGPLGVMDLKKCQVREIVLKRWSPEKNRELIK
ncbi:tRNA splicing endonuclease subunit sen2 [Apophysomyces sp. BC1034]|nr:tRNA splicing endonuclease subunit sen2 [Apophysomyces sp. BC1015]KAG0176482.1 tRNA splicing endonuclease subunit sen2 [Apophysomyces sp. BC1021]KAG0191564.1 tRNA splicing endonuclease subunit sen2 [Apophysomyces sp. BC1034]